MLKICVAFFVIASARLTLNPTRVESAVNHVLFLDYVSLNRFSRVDYFAKATVISIKFVGDNSQTYNMSAKGNHAITIILNVLKTSGVVVRKVDNAVTA